MALSEKLFVTCIAQMIQIRIKFYSNKYKTCILLYIVFIKLLFILLLHINFFILDCSSLKGHYYETN